MKSSCTFIRSGEHSLPPRRPLGGTKSSGQTASGGRFNYNIQRLGIRAALRGLRAFPPCDRIDAARQDTWFRNAHNHGIA